MAGSLSREEKERLLKAIEEDREFRYALMGLLGYKEVLDRILELQERVLKLEEKVAKLEERVAKLEERVVRLEERVAKLEEKVLKLEERIARLEERVLKLEERVARLEERVLRLEERLVRLEERVVRVEEELRETRRLVMIVAHRFGVLSEEAFRQGMRFVVEEVLGAAKVERWTYRDEEGFVYGHPSMVDVDVVVKDGEHILVEVKSRVSKADVAELYRIGLLYERVEGVKPRLAIIGGFVDPDAEELAEKLGVRIIPAVKE